MLITKENAALAALEYIEDGMTLGLGSGSTAEIFIKHLGLLVADGMKIIGVPTSKRTEAVAIENGIPFHLSHCAATRLWIHEIIMQRNIQEMGKNIVPIKSYGSAKFRHVADTMHNHTRTHDIVCRNVPGQPWTKKSTAGSNFGFTQVSNREIPGPDRGISNFPG